jgi:hypothetical protein
MTPHEISKPTSVLFQLAWKSFSYSYGTFTLGAFVLLAYVRKSGFRKLDANGKKELALGKSDLFFRLLSAPTVLICLVTPRASFDLDYELDPAHHTLSISHESLLIHPS